MTKPHYDIIINGGGIVGFTLLNLIQKSPILNRFKVLLVEQGAKPTKNLYETPRYANELHNGHAEDECLNLNVSNRVSSISPESCDIFNKLGVWSGISQYTKDINEIQVWNYDPYKKLVFKGEGHSFNTSQSKGSLFSVVENYRLSSILSENAVKSVAESIMWEHHLVHFQESNDRSGAISLTLQNNTSDQKLDVTGCLVLGCDGFKSKVRSIAGIKYREENLKKKAVVGTVRMASNGSPNNTAYQRFSNERDTVAALLPVDDTYCSFVISAPEEYSQYLESISSEAFVDEFNTLLTKSESPRNWIIKGLHNSFDSTIGTLANMLKSTSPSLEMNYDSPYIDSLVEGSRASFPLFFGTTSPKMVAKLNNQKYAQIALLGDSSHRIHPLAGQGLNLGLQDAKILFTEIEKTIKLGLNPFSLHDLSTLEKVLKKYECQRQTFLIPMCYGIIGMPSLFKMLPSSLVSLINGCDPIKNASIKFASGSNIKF